MVGRNDCVIADALEALANVMEQAQQNQQAKGGDRGLDMFPRNNPPTFKGKYDLEGAQVQLQDIEKIFRVMAYRDAQKVLNGTYIISREVEYWWDNTRDNGSNWY